MLDSVVTKTGAESYSTDYVWIENCSELDFKTWLKDILAMNWKCMEDSTIHSCAKEMVNNLCWQFSKQKI